jgi:hypothetical protein
MIQAAMRDESSIKMPPTREGLDLLFKKLNLYVDSKRIFECLVYCRGKELEDAPEDDFTIEKLWQWLEINLRTLHHIDTDNIQNK